ncbi:hypothetical protein, partial [Escherichia coli]|uniref:hypothetical protein n=1 Tax=Escherichia coli TaxID=562 RepID=UPI003B82AAE5
RDFLKDWEWNHHMYEPAITLLGIYPKVLKSIFYNNTYVRMFRSAQFTMAKLWNQPRCPLTDERIKKM